MFLTSLVQIERRGENFCEMCRGKSHVHYSQHSQRVEADYYRISTCMGYFWEYQVCNWTGTVTIQIVVPSVPFSPVSIV